MPDLQTDDGAEHARQPSGLTRSQSRAGSDLDCDLGRGSGNHKFLFHYSPKAFLSGFAKRELDARELQAVEVSGLSLARQFYLVYHRRRPLSPAASTFLYFLESHPIGSAGR